MGVVAEFLMLPVCFPQFALIVSNILDSAELVGAVVLKGKIVSIEDMYFLA